MTSFSNGTVLSNPQEIFLAVPRMLARVGAFAFITVPEKLDEFLYGNGISMIAQATGGNGSKSMLSATLSRIPGSVAKASPRSVAAAIEGTTETTPHARSLFSSVAFHQLRNFGGIVSYMTSKWALACFCLVNINMKKQWNH